MLKNDLSNKGESIMAITDNLKLQHTDLLSIAAQMSELMTPEKLSNDAIEIRKLLSKLSGKLEVHLAMEDKVLYPRLIKHSDDNIRSVAQQFIDQMGGISSTFQQYKSKWYDIKAISQNATGFISETNGIFEVLCS